MSTKERGVSLLHYIGGKGLMAKKILPYVPVEKGQLYCEPFCGGASIFFARERSTIEVLNDTYGLLINFYRVMQDTELFREFYRRIYFTLYSRNEFVDAIKLCKEHAQDSFEIPNVDLAVAFLVGIRQGFSGKLPHKLVHGNWGRSFVKDRPKTWGKLKKSLEWYHERLQGAYIDAMDGIQCMQYWDRENAVFYVDPPYVHSTRKNSTYYFNELDDSYHEKLIDVLLTVKGHCVVSSYPNDLYDRLVRSGIYKKVEFKTASHAAGKARNSGLQGTGAALKKVPRIEVLYVKKSRKGH